MNQIFNKPVSKEISHGKAVFRYEPTKSKENPVTGLLKLSDKEAYWIFFAVSFFDGCHQQINTKLYD